MNNIFQKQNLIFILKGEIVLKKNSLKRIVSVLLAVMMVLSLMVQVTAVEPATVVGGVDKVYWGEQIGYGKKLVETDASTYYDYDEATDTYTRKDYLVSNNSNSWFMPFIMAGNYRDFKLEFDMTFGTGLAQQWFSILAGSEKSTFGWENGSGAELIRIGTATTFTTENPTVSGQDVFKLHTQSMNADNTQHHGNWKGKYPSEWDGTKAFHVTMTASGGYYRIVFAVDGTVFHTVTDAFNPLYDGGYIGLAAPNKGMKLANITISDMPTEEYAYTGGINAKKAHTEISTYFNVEEVTVGEGDSAYTTKKFTRNSNDADGKGWDWTKQVNFGIHDEFQLTFKGKFANNAQQYFNIFFGEKVVGYPNYSTGATRMHFGYAGGKVHAYTQASEGGVWGDVGGGLHLKGYTGYPAIDYTAEHTYTITVKDGVWTYDVDGVWSQSRALNAFYDGGYVTIGCNANGSYFYDVKITDYVSDAVEDLVYLRPMNNYVSKLPEAVATYYNVTADESGNKTYTRNGTTTGSGDSNHAFLTVGKGKDFRLDFDYDFAGDAGTLDNYPIYLNIGNSVQNGFRRDWGSLTLGLRASNVGGWIFFGQTQTTTAEDGSTTSSIVSKSGWTDGYNTTAYNYRGGSYIRATSAKGHATVVVADGLLTVYRYIDGVESSVSYQLSDLYNTGFVQLGINRAGTSVSNIEFELLDDVAAPFTAYYTDSLGEYQSSNVSGSEDLTPKALGEDWSWDGNTLSYKLAPSNAAFKYKMSVAYLNTQKYTDFELSFDFRGSRETWNPIFVGFGAEMGKSWMTDNCIKAERTYEPDDGNQFLYLRPNGQVSYGPSSSYLAGKTSADQAGSWYYDAGTLGLAGVLYDEAVEYYAYHNCVIRVENGKAAVYIDGKVQGVMSLIGNYDGGYIYFASNRYGASYRNIKVTDLTDETASYDIDGFTAYHSDMISNDSTLDAGMTQVKASENWSYNPTTKTVSRNISANNAESDSPATKSNWAQLFYNTKLENFEMEVDITDGADMWKRMYIGVGAKNIGEHFMGNDGGFALHGYPDGVSYKNATDIITETEDGNYYNQDGQLVNKDGVYINADGKAISYFGFNLAGRFWNNEGYKYEWRPAQDNTNTYSRTYHVRLVVQDRLLSIYVNGSETPATCWTMPIWYEENEGGYISFGTTSSCASFANFTVNGVDAFEITENENLNGKTALFVGDSISNGHTDIAMMYAWGGRIGRKYGMTWINESHSGSNLAEKGDGSGQTIAEQIVAHGNRDIDYVIIEGGVNDAMNKLPVGQISASYNKEDFDLYTFAGSLEYAFAYATETWGDNPEFRIGYLVTFQNRWTTKEGTAAHYSVARAICQKWNVPCLDLNGDSVASALDIENKTYIPDGIHPNAAGYEILTETYIEPWMANLAAWGGLENNLRGNVDGDEVVGAGDLAYLKQALLTNAYDGFDFGDVDIIGELRYITPDLNGDTVIDILDLIRLKKIIAELA